MPVDWEMPPMLLLKPLPYPYEKLGERPVLKITPGISGRVTIIKYEAKRKIIKLVLRN